MQFQRVQKKNEILSIRRLRAWNIERLQYEIREIIFPKRKPKAESRKCEEILQK